MTPVDLVRYFARVVGVTISDDDLSKIVAAPLLEISLAGAPVDSMDVVEFLISLGDDLEVDLFAVVDEQGIDTLIALSHAIADRCDAEIIETVVKELCSEC